MKKERKYKIIEVCRREKLTNVLSKHYQVGYEKWNVFGIAKVKYLEYRNFQEPRRFSDIDDAKRFIADINSGKIWEDGLLRDEKEKRLCNS